MDIIFLPPRHLLPGETWVYFTEVGGRFYQVTERIEPNSRTGTEEIECKVVWERENVC